MPGNVGLSFKEAMTSFLEVYLHTLLYLRAVYPPSTFTKRRAHGVPVFQSRHPLVREYVAEVVALLGREMARGNLRRVTTVIKSAETGLPMERFLLDVEFGEGVVGLSGPAMELGLGGAPDVDELGVYLRGLLIRLTTLESQLEDNHGELTFAIVVETKDEFGPNNNAATDGGPDPWIPALKADVLSPPLAAAATATGAADDCTAEHEPLLHVKAVETGVIDMRLMVQECYAKTGIRQLKVNEHT